MNTEEQIVSIMRQTNYTREETENKLLEHDNNMIHVIREFMGLPLYNNTSKNTRTKASLQQEMFTQIRKQLDLSIRDFNQKQNDKLEKELNGL